MRRINTPNKAPDLFGPGKDGFRNGDLAIGVLPTELDADFFNHVQEELANLTESMGITLNPANRSQVLEAVQRMIDVQAGNYMLDTGAANAYVVAMSPAITAYTDGLTIRVRAVNANTTGATINAGGGVIPLVNDVGAALLAGDVPAGGVFTATFDSALNKFLITSLVPSQVMTQSQADIRYANNAQTINVVMAANAVTISPLNAEPLTFKSAVAGNGSTSNVANPSANLVIPVGASLGAVNGQPSMVVVAEMNNGGVREYAVANISGGLQMDERNLISTTAISGVATAANVWYSTTARAGLPYRIVAVFVSTQAAAGTWATAASDIQPVFGEALAALSSFGFGQKPIDVIGSRSVGTTYYNTSGKPRFVTVGGANGSTGVSLNVTVNGLMYQFAGCYLPSGTAWAGGTFLVPAGQSYMVSTGFTPAVWVEVI